MSDAVLGFAALMETARATARDVRDASALKHALHGAKIATKQGAVNAERAKQDGERTAAAEKLGGAVALAAVQAALAAATSSSSDGPATATDKALAACKELSAKLIPQSVDYYSKLAGGERQADEAALVVKRYEMLEAVIDDVLDTTRDSYEGAKEQLKESLRVITETSERMSQVMQKLTG
jgi:hypothetical protein